MCVDFDVCECRYFFVGGIDGSVCVYDIEVVVEGV